jgi:hypothetical protein
MANLNVRENVVVLAVLFAMVQFVWAFVAWLAWAFLAFILPDRLHGEEA